MKYKRYLLQFKHILKNCLNQVGFDLLPQLKNISILSSAMLFCTANIAVLNNKVKIAKFFIQTHPIN